MRICLKKLIFEDDTTYRGEHGAPEKANGTPLHDLTGLYPDDVYSYRGAIYYGHFGHNDPMDCETMSIIHRYRNHPNKFITVYRAIPKDVKGNITVGDWVTINRQYAKYHGETNLLGKYKIIKKLVHARDIFNDATSIHEWGYDPQPEVPRTKEQNIKRYQDMLKFYISRNRMEDYKKYKEMLDNLMKS